MRQTPYLEVSLDHVAYTTIASTIGAVTGGLSLLFLLVIVGVYKERVDRHERWFNLLVDDSLTQAWRGGHVQRGSFKSKPETVAAFSPELRTACETAAKEATGRKQAPTYAILSDLLLKNMNHLATEAMDAGMTPMELFGALVTYASELAGVEDDHQA